MNILRRLPLSRLLLLCALVVVLGISLTALALALGTAPTPPPKPLAQAVHDALAAPPVQGVSASVEFTDHLLEGSQIASASGAPSQLSGSPLISGASGRLWIAKDGRLRLELQAEQGDTQVLYDGAALTVYDASSNTLYRSKLPEDEADRDRDPSSSPDPHEVPSVAKIEEAIRKLEHVEVSAATPTNVAGQPAYTERISPKEGGSLIGGLELSWDAAHGVPLRLALYSSESSVPVLELAARDISYGPVPDSVFDVHAPANAKVEDVALPGAHADSAAHAHDHPEVSVHGKGITGVAVAEAKTKPGEEQLELPEQLPKKQIGSATATELPTALGTLLTFERDGVRYLLAGAVAPVVVEAVARGL